MDYEKKLKDALKDENTDYEVVRWIESNFPELKLKESKDERIRKRLIDFFEDWGENRSHCWGIAVTDILAWLEKKGELTQSVTNTSEQESNSYKDAEEASAEYRKFREECGIKDPVMLDEIEEAYYNGATSIQKPAWSDEDEKMLDFCIKHYADGNCITWLESLKTRLKGK